MARILVTGGAGYVGSVCCAELLRLGHAVTAVDDLSTGFRNAVPAEASFYQLDIGDRLGMRDLLRNVSFDAVFHFAAKAVVGESVVNPGVFFDRNVASGIALLESLREAGLKSFIFSSTAAVYGIPEHIPIAEDSSLNPINSYGETKLILERILQWYARAYRWSVVAFRYFNAAGATAELGERHNPETHIIPLVLQAAAGEREAFDIYGGDYETPDGSCLRDYVHVLDIAQAHICALGLMDRPGMNVYNIGLGTTYSVRQICAAAEKVTGRRIPVRMAPRREGDPPVLCASPRRVIEELGWKPKHSSLEEILSSAWKWKLRYAGVPASITR